MKICKQCGNNLSDEDKCPKCGYVWLPNIIKEEKELYDGYCYKNNQACFYYAPYKPQNNEMITSEPNACIITKVELYTSRVIIPHKHGNQIIIGIGDSVFAENKKLEDVRIEDGIKFIGKNCFYGCNNLILADLPSSLIQIEEKAFAYCSSLMEINIPEKVKSIGEQAFFQCIQLSQITLPNSLTNIGASCFSYCTQLKKLEFPNSIFSYGASLLAHCYSLVEITLNNGFYTIPSKMFNHCISLIEYTVPLGIEKIGNGAFYDCTNLGKITFPNTVSVIEAFAFQNCTSLKVIIILNDDIKIAQNAFEYFEYVKVKKRVDRSVKKLDGTRDYRYKENIQYETIGETHTHTLSDVTIYCNPTLKCIEALKSLNFKISFLE